MPDLTVRASLAFIDSVLFAVLDFFVGAIADWYDDVLRAALSFPDWYVVRVD